jgi:hypothetical protein
MKKIFTIGALVFTLALTVSSCSKDYLQTNPTTQIATADAFSTTTNAQAALNGIHRILFSQTFGQQSQGGQSGNMLYMDIMGEDMVMNTTSSAWLRSEYQWQSHRTVSSAINEYNYSFYYVIIGNANMIIANIDNATGPQATKDVIKGEALTFRAWAYFQMVQLFGERFVAGAANSGLGVPLVLTPTVERTARNTVAQVYTQINTDIDAAIGLLAGYTRPNKSHFDVKIAKGIKARIALTQQNYAVAAQMASEARVGFTLMSNTQYQAGFNDYSNPEWMWGSKIVADQTNFFYSFFAYQSSNYNSTVVRTSPKSIFSKLYNQITATDVRKKLWDPTGTNTASFPIAVGGTRYPYISNKFRVADLNLSIGDVPYMRAAEMYLIEAEAKARANDNAGAAAALLPLAVNRDPSYTLSTKTGAALIEEIMNQRRVELWGEGFRFYDLKRTNSALDRTGGNHSATITNGVLQVAPTDIRWQFLIPLEEINIGNGVVVQNPQS